ncbi:hypothetical protein VTL71DRAFT_11383 [Oculimacula yallundae]|uniref:Uncharacterized protein n=1 Tax=Oculimacula yallundae TaxID=86028 RepID=A0ABR4CQC0_9HELO
MLGPMTWSEPREPPVDRAPQVDSGFDEAENECEIGSSATTSDLIMNDESTVVEPYIITPQIHLTFSYATWIKSIRSLPDHRLSKAVLGCGELTLSWLDESVLVDPSSTVVKLARDPGSFEETFDELAGSCNFYVVKGRDVVSIKTTYL